MKGALAQGIYDVSATPKHKLFDTVIVGGNVYVYHKNSSGDTISKGTIVAVSDTGVGVSNRTRQFGVAVIDVPDGYYAWFLVKGKARVLADSGVNTSSVLYADTGVAKVFQAQPASNDNTALALTSAEDMLAIVGIALSAPTTDDDGKVRADAYIAL